ncbi:MAG TPA: permease, partial [Candidatus Fermentibacter sp.]|nr:permease [Candidatus Fermentibacter sp.]
MSTFPSELWRVSTEIAPPLLLGLAVAGILHVLVKKDRIFRHLGRPGLSSTLKASLWGVPLPLCSCGVIPTAMSLRRDGASPGATTAFLVSTPQTG